MYMEPTPTLTRYWDNTRAKYCYQLYDNYEEFKGGRAWANRQSEHYNLELPPPEPNEELTEEAIKDEITTSSPPTNLERLA